MAWRVMLTSAGLVLGLGIAFAQPTPPVSPKIQEVPLPPPIELAGPASLPPDLPTRPLTAQEAAALALHYHPAISTAGAGVSEAEARVQEAGAGLQPSLTVSGGYTHVDTDSPGGASSALGGAAGYQVSATLRQLVYDFDHGRDLVRQAMAQERWANATLTKVQADLVLQVKLAFYYYLQNVRMVRVSEATVRNQQEHLALAQARLKSGLGLPYDVVRAETAYVEAVYGLTVARNNTFLARVNLAELLGIDPRTPLEPAETGEPVLSPDDLTQLVEQALEQRPEMIQAPASVEAATYAVRAARTSNSPALVGSLGAQRRGEGFPPHRDTVSIGLAVEWSAYDSGLTAGRIKEAQANLQAAQAYLASVRLAVISEVSQAYLNLKAAEQGVVTADAQVTNAQEALRLAEGRYRAGVGVFLDVLDAQTALDTASTNRVNALSSLDQARAALSHAVGEDWMRPVASED